MRNFQKIKELSDYRTLDRPYPITFMAPPIPKSDSVMILRMLVRAKYGDFKIPPQLEAISSLIKRLADLDYDLTGIEHSWCYVTIRHGLIKSMTDDEWHFDGSSFRTDIIPERNYVWVSNNPTEYKVGRLSIPNDFDPLKHNLFTFAAKQLEKQPVILSESQQWYLLSPFCLHRRPKLDSLTFRTFFRICFSDIEGRDINNTTNDLLPTPFYGRNPVQSFRNQLIDYYK